LAFRDARHPPLFPLSLHDALPIYARRRMLDFAGQNVIRTVLAGVLGRFLPGIGHWIGALVASAVAARLSRQDEYEADAFAAALIDRKSTRLNSSHVKISYAVFCLK